ERAMLNTHAEPPAAFPRPPALAQPACRLCGSRLHRSLLDLGCIPLANRTVAAGDTGDRPYPLHARICDTCMLAQIEDVAPPETVIARTPYLSSRSVTCVDRARRFADTMRKRFRLDGDSLVIEIGSNDGYLLRHFQAAGIPVLGIEPAPNAAAAAADLGIPTEIGFFNTETAMEIAVRHGRANLVVANNVLPHVPDLFDFAASFAGILRPNGVLSLQVPHLLSLVQGVQFDAFRHDSYTYLSLRVLERVLRSVGLRVFDAERLPDHGGSLRVHACHAVGPHAIRPGLKTVRLAEGCAELDQRDFYAGFSDRVASAQADIRDFLRVRRAAGRLVAAYGAATRGATLLNCCGITAEEIACVADPDPAKQGRLLPGSRVPIVPREALMDRPPHDLVILPWPNAAEIAAVLQPLRQRGTQLWTALPRITRV
ncbi:MAG: class I SAM-dependent methyltransferase, partial [Rhodopila sp.]|nr:class I SAM-dependent methyltransferase [Rhodopila sp.]